MFNYQGYCPYMYVPCCYVNPMMRMPAEQTDTEDNNYYRSIENNEDLEELVELNFEAEDLRDNEELEYLVEAEERSAADVDRVMASIEPRQRALFDQLERLGIRRTLSRYMVRNIVMFVDTNYNKYRGTIQQKVTASLNDLRRQYPWIFFVMRAYGVPAGTINQAVRSILTYSFQNLRRP